MLNDYIRSVETLKRLRRSCVGPYLDDLTVTMAGSGFKSLTILDHLRSILLFSCWAERRGTDLADWDDSLLVGYRRRLVARRLGKRKRVIAHIAQFLAFLRVRKLIAPATLASAPACAAILQQFSAWMLQDRRLTPRTLARYRPALQIFVSALGENPASYDVTRIRAFVIEQLRHRGRCESAATVKAIRAFLQFLVAEGRVAPGIQHCVPTVPQWRLSSLPRYLETPDVERVIASCDLTTGHGLRDHAILLLLSRLGLRAGDVVAMRFGDVDWRCGTIRVKGKSQREAVLPLPQDVGDAILEYLECGRPKSDSTHVFLTVLAPTRPFASSSAVSDIVRFALSRAGIRNPPTRGAHLLRHSAATAMLRSGGSLETIATVLRHRSPQTTAHYAKVDVAMLQEIAQPWPEGASC